jgi:hypothetical protein
MLLTAMTRLLKPAIVSLSCLALLGLSTGPETAAAGWKKAPVVPKIDKGSRAKLLVTLQRGWRLGNRANVFAKVGDSLTESAAFAQGMGCRRWVPGRFKRLRPGIRHFSARGLPGTSTYCPGVNSFSRNSAATKGGKTSYWPLQVGAAEDPSCASYESPLVCEVRLTRPAYALILLGANDLALAKGIPGADPLPGFLSNMDQIVRSTRALGVAPILTTLPPRTFTPEDAAAGERVNAGLHRLAVKRRVPLMNLWRALAPLPNSGLASDRVHLSLFGGPECLDVCDPNTCAPGCQPASFTRAGLGYGYNVFNLSTALLLDRLVKLSRERREGERAGR